MDLDKLCVAVRPRNGWEAVDLGFAMARHWFRPLWLLWLALAFPVAVLAHLLLLSHPWFALLLVWWLKPLYESLLLHWLSHALFGEHPPVTEVLRRTRAIATPQLVPALLWRRLALGRSFNMPVAALEGLRGTQRAERLRVLHRGQSVPGWFTVVAVHLEAVLYLALLTVAVLAVPEELRWIDVGSALTGADRLTQLLQNLCYFAAMSLIAPFYVAGGFALYLTRRAGLEAWDLELRLRQLLARARPRRAPARVAATLLAVGIGTALLAGSPTARAQPLSAEQARAGIERVLADPAFGRVETVHRWVYTGEDDAPGPIRWQLLSAQLLRTIAGAAEVVLWLALATAVVWLALRLRRDAPWWRRRRAPVPRGSAPPRLFGLPVSAQSLPDDPVAGARAALERGEARAALSLLYRAALAVLLHRYQVDIPGSATEGEAVRLVASARPREQAAYFARLTGDWLALAYAGRRPGAARLQALCDDWPRFFAE